MSGNKDVLIYQKEKSEKSAKLINQSDLIFCLDFSSLNRINDFGERVRKSSAKKVLIDRHLEPERFADFEQWDDTAASTAELVFELIVDLGDKHLVDAISQTALCWNHDDTGSFRHSNTSHQVFKIASELVERGANPYKVSKLIYDTNTIERLRLMGYVLSEKLQVLPEYRTAYIVL